MKIRTNVLLAFAAPTFVLIVMGVLLFMALTQNLDTSSRVRHSEQVIGQGNLLLVSVVDAETGMRGFVITRQEGFLAPFTEGNATFDQTARTLEALVSDNPPQVARIDQVGQSHQRWLATVARPVIAWVRAGGVNVDKAVKLIDTGAGKAIVDHQRALVAAFLATEEGLLHSGIATSDSAARTARFVLIGGLGLVTVLLLALGFGLSKRLSDGAQTERDLKESLQDAVRDYSQFAASVAAGDLTATVATNGSQDLKLLSENLNNMVAGLADISGQVRTGALAITSSTSEILAAVSQHTASASQQSAAISETSTTVDEVRAASEQTARRAGEVAEQAKSSMQVSDEGTEAVEMIARAMEEIRERVEAIARDILTLSEQTQQIGEITTTVDDLAGQSNILALNASIEAAKAGDHGKGFAVVASEVRNLAEQSKGATAQVRRVLGDIQNATSTAVLATEQGTKVVEEGLELSSRAGDRIRSLADTIREASHAAQQIAASSHEQSVGMDQIAHAMKDVNEGTTQFVAGAHESQKAAADLNELAEKLAAMTERYRV
jgi:methyl-accepting chemotaxis protein